MSDDSKTFVQRVVWTGAKTADVIGEAMPVIKCGGQGQTGEPRYHTPEDLLVAAVTTCFVLGVIAFLDKMRINIKALETVGIGRLERVDRSFEITEVRLRARAVIESEEIRDRVQRALELGAKYCFVGNSLKCPVTHEYEIVIV